MQEFKIFFINNGGAVLQTESYSRKYHDMNRLATDYLDLMSGGDTISWCGNSPDSRMRYSNEDEIAGYYFTITEQFTLDNFLKQEVVDGMPAWQNIREFAFAALDQYQP